MQQDRYCFYSITPTREWPRGPPRAVISAFPRAVRWGASGLRCVRAPVVTAHHRSRRFTARVCSANEPKKHNAPNCRVARLGNCGPGDQRHRRHVRDGSVLQFQPPPAADRRRDGLVRGRQILLFFFFLFVHKILCSSLRAHQCACFCVHNVPGVYPVRVTRRLKKHCTFSAGRPSI